MEDLLVKYPAAKKVINDYYLQKLLDSLRTNDLPEDFKMFVQERGVDDKQLYTILESNPRTMFDVFDQNEILIVVSPINFNEWQVQINFKDYEGRFESRIEAEKFAIGKAFEKLESKLLEANKED